MSELNSFTVDDFLGGKLKLKQPVDGYRAGADPVFLAASVKAKTGHSILDIGCGAGAALFCLATRISGLDLYGIEVQNAYAELAKDNAVTNGLQADIRVADIQALPDDLRNKTFDHVITNPPYFKLGAGKPSQNDSKELAFRGTVSLRDWVQICAKRVAPKGYINIVQRIERLPEILSALDGGLGSVNVIPFAARVGRNPHLAIVQAQKNGRGDFVLQSPVILHDGGSHTSDKDDYSALAKSILRDGGSLSF